MPSTQNAFADRAAHRSWLASQAALPAGFRVGTSRFEFTPAEAPKPAKMNLTLIALDRPSGDFAAVFTRNAFPGAPVIVGRGRLSQPELSAILINNKISNVCAPGGVEASERVCAEAARLLGVRATSVLPSSTGVIGWGLPVEAMLKALPAAVASLAAGSVLPAAEGIVTTDLYPKVRSASVGGGRIVAIAKGAGMIEPNMATMLGFLTTDAAVDVRSLQLALQSVADASFNRVVVDGDRSTNDTLILLANGAAGNRELSPAHPQWRVFYDALLAVAMELAKKLVLDGEGATKMVTVCVTGARTDREAQLAARAIAKSALVKTSWFGVDPNWGRVICAAGYSGAAVNDQKAQIWYGGVCAYDRGRVANAATLRKLKAVMKARAFDVTVNLNLGKGEDTIFTCDFSLDYVKINADYTT